MLCFQELSWVFRFIPFPFYLSKRKGICGKNRNLVGNGNLYIREFFRFSHQTEQEKPERPEFRPENPAKSANRKNCFCITISDANYDTHHSLTHIKLKYLNHPYPSLPNITPLHCITLTNTSIPEPLHIPAWFKPSPYQHPLNQGSLDRQEASPEREPVMWYTDAPSSREIGKSCNSNIGSQGRLVYLGFR